MIMGAAGYCRRLGRCCYWLQQAEDDLDGDACRCQCSAATASELLTESRVEISVVVCWLGLAVRKGQQPPWVVPDELWARIEPLLPVIPRRADHPGRRRLDDRKVLSGTLFVLYTGIPREFLPRELGFGSGMTCWRRLRDWHQAGVWQQPYEALLAELNGAGALDWSKAVIGSSYVRAMKGGPKRVRARPAVPGRARSTM